MKNVLVVNNVIDVLIVSNVLIVNGVKIVLIVKIAKIVLKNMINNICYIINNIQKKNIKNYKI